MINKEYDEAEIGKNHEYRRATEPAAARARGTNPPQLGHLGHLRPIGGTIGGRYLTPDMPATPAGPPDA